MHRAVDTALEFLIAAEMILEIGEHLGATELGTLVSRMYIDPRSASQIVTTLREKDVYADLGLVQLICSTSRHANTLRKKFRSSRALAHDGRQGQRTLAPIANGRR